MFISRMFFWLDSGFFIFLAFFRVFEGQFLANFPKKAKEKFNFVVPILEAPELGLQKKSHLLRLDPGTCPHKTRKSLSPQKFIPSNVSPV